VDGRLVTDVVGKFIGAYVGTLPEERRQLFARYRVVDVARKVVGVGSVGTRCWIVLLIGNDRDDPPFLQYKEAQASVLTPYWKSPAWECEGKRVVVGQRLIQGAPDIFLGWCTDRVTGDYYIRQLRDMKGGATLDPEATPPSGFPEYCSICGWALAQAHAKSGDPAAIAGYLGKSNVLDEALTRFAFAYAEQNDRDYDTLKRAAKSKRIKVAEWAS
jgi:hypothetical protein